MPDPEPSPSAADDFDLPGKENLNGKRGSEELLGISDVGGRAGGFMCHVCTGCTAQNWIDPSWELFTCWSCGSYQTVGLDWPLR
jgi:hypothetical protein